MVLADNFADAQAFPLLQGGVKGLLTYEEASEQLPRAIEALGAGSYWVPRTLLSRFVESILRKAHPRLSGALTNDVTRREQQVLGALLENLSNKEIASRFNIAERTVKFHVSNILSKFGVQRRADLILLAAQSQVPRSTS